MQSNDETKLNNTKSHLSTQEADCRMCQGRQMWALMVVILFLCLANTYNGGVLCIFTIVLSGSLNICLISFLVFLHNSSHMAIERKASISQYYQWVATNIFLHVHPPNYFLFEIYNTIWPVSKTDHCQVIPVTTMEDCGWKTDNLLSKNEHVSISFTKKRFHDSITALVLLMFTSTLNVKFNTFFLEGRGFFGIWNTILACGTKLLVICCRSQYKSCQSVLTTNETQECSKHCHDFIATIVAFLPMLWHLRGRQPEGAADLSSNEFWPYLSYDTVAADYTQRRTGSDDWQLTDKKGLPWGRL